jgi:hypothetical protein
MGRFSTAWKAFWRILRDDTSAEAWENLSKAPLPEKAAPAAVPPAEAGIRGDAVYSLVLLQRTGRLVDFLNEDISGYSDEQVGAAVRQIHQKCGAVLEENFGVSPILPEGEGSQVEIAPGFDPSTIRLVGNVAGDPPFKGTVRHPGWRVARVDFPERNESIDPAVIAPAEVEL